MLFASRLHQLLITEQLSAGAMSLLCVSDDAAIKTVYITGASKQAKSQSFWNARRGLDD
jgi:hypothetical protein